MANGKDFDRLKTKERGVLSGNWSSKAHKCDIIPTTKKGFRRRRRREAGNGGSRNELIHYFCQKEERSSKIQKRK